MDKNVMFSSKSDNWATPKFLYKVFMDMGYYDPCPYMDYEIDGLTTCWKDHNFVNPPYSMVSRWVDKAIEESKKGNCVVLLIPARTDTRYFKKLWQFGCHFVFFTGRLNFNDGYANAPFPSVLIWLNGVESHCSLYDPKEYAERIRCNG